MCSRSCSVKVLKVAGVLTAITSIMHVAIIVGGADWYRFFGAGEEMAVMNEQGSIYPAVITGVIAIILAIWSAYAFSGAKVLRKLPLTKIVLSLIATVFLARGLLGIPAVIYSDSTYMSELAESMMFMVVSSLISFIIGSCYGLGAYKFKSDSSNT
jgi:putative oxidoreductase